MGRRWLVSKGLGPDAAILRKILYVALNFRHVIPGIGPIIGGKWLRGADCYSGGCGTQWLSFGRFVRSHRSGFLYWFREERIVGENTGRFSLVLLPWKDGLGPFSEGCGRRNLVIHILWRLWVGFRGFEEARIR